MASFLDSLRESFRIADAADILLVAVLVYALLIWFKSTASRSMVLGIGLLAIVFVAARAFDLYMTTAIFRAFLAFAAIVVVIVFQEDFRRLFSRVATLGKRPHARTEHTDNDINLVVELLFDLARKKVGALVVFRGVEPLDRHISGGIPTDARISKPLLDSIFDPHSQGHDGAVLIDHDRIWKFAARLPLSENISEIGNTGTRHTAALGLSELSDAIVIAVSEERGEVSIAERGKLTRATSPGELVRRLDEFTHRVRPRNAPAFGHRLLVENSSLKVIALVVACAAWFLTSFETETVQKTFVVPIVYRNLPETLDVDDAAPTEARVTLTGLERAFNLLAPHTLSISLDLSDVDEGLHQVAIDESHIRLPSRLTMFRSVPRVVSLDVHTWTKARVPIEVQTQGRLRRDLRDREIRVAPEEVQVSIWRSMKSANASTITINTEPVDLSKVTESTDVKAKLIVPQFMKLDSEQPVEVRIRLVEEGHATDALPQNQ